MTLAGKWCPCLGIDEIRGSPNFVSLPMLKRPGNHGGSITTRSFHARRSSAFGLVGGLARPALVVVCAPRYAGWSGVAAGITVSTECAGSPCRVNTSPGAARTDSRSDANLESSVVGTPENISAGSSALTAVRLMPSSATGPSGFVATRKLRAPHPVEVSTVRQPEPRGSRPCRPQMCTHELVVKAETSYGAILFDSRCVETVSASSLMSMR